jgi:hypothetical protein
MRNIIIKNDQGKTLSVHVYGEYQLRKYYEDLVYFHSTLPNFWKIETNWVYDEDTYVEGIINNLYS